MGRDRSSVEPLSTSELERRKPVWHALSFMYLDTENTEVEFDRIADSLFKSGYSLEEIDMINRTEVFPAVGNNLMATAGAWDEFDPEALAEAVVVLRRRSTKLGRWITSLTFDCVQGMHKKDWYGVRESIRRKQSGSDSAHT